MIDPNLQKLQDISDKISSGQIDPNDIIGMFSDSIDPMPSDEEIANQAKSLEDSLTPVPMILSDNDISDLTCQYSGEELANRIFWSILDKQGFLRNINNKPDFSSNTKFDNFLNDNNLGDQLQISKEMVSDNLDLDNIGIVFKKPNIKTRNYSVGPFKFLLNVITNKGIPLFYHIAPPPVSVDTILKKLEENINSNPTKPCVDIFNNKYNSPSVDPKILLDTLKTIISKNDNIKKANNIFDVVDDIFCDPDIPINPETGNPLFNQTDLTSFLKDICKPIPDTSIPTPLPTGNIEDVADSVSSCLQQTKSIFNDIREKNELKSRYQKAETEINEILYYYQIIQNYHNGLYNSFINKFSDTKTISSNETSIDDILNSVDSKNYISALKDFSCRIRSSDMIKPAPIVKLKVPVKTSSDNSYYGLNFVIEYLTGLGNSLPYQTTKVDVQNDLLSQDYKSIDLTKLQIGMEFSAGGIFSGYKHNFFSSLDNFITFKDSNPKTLSDLYSFVGDIQNTSKTKDQILQKLREDHGFLYSNLIESSSSPWLFFTQEQRGDNDARKSQDIKPASSGQDGQPNKEFTEFYSNFKASWDKQYNLKVTETINKISDIKKLSDILTNRLANYYINSKVNSFYSSKANSSVNISNISTKDLNTILDSTKSTLKQVSDNINLRVDEIKNILLEIGSQIAKLDQENSPDNINKKAKAISCATSSNNQAGLPVECPSDCCGAPGQAIDKIGLSGNSNSPDCPTIYTTCYWKEFSKKLNTVGSIPYPSGLPPIENPMPYPIGLKYWPVGYLPPSIIPLPPPIVNPLDGLPMIRIPLPMVWTVIDPIIIPLPIGIIVIFIPFIGGFMPSPLVFLHDFLTNNSIFLLGLRGFRFIPKKSDPTINDMLKTYKQSLTKGVPNYMFPFSNLGKDNVDSVDRIKKEIISNLTKQLSNVNKDFDFSPIQTIQDDINTNIESYNKKILESKRKSALGDSDYKQHQKELDEYIKSLNIQKINSVKKCIGEYLGNLIDLPDVQFPKQSSNLIAEIPSAIKIPNDISAKQKIGSIPSPTTINLKSRILTAVKQYEIESPDEFIDYNQNLSSEYRIVAQFDVEIGSINDDGESLKKFNNLINDLANNVINGIDSPLTSKALLLFKPSLNTIPKTGGSQISIPGSINKTDDPRISDIKDYIFNNIGIKGSDVVKIANTNSISRNKVLRQMDLKRITGNILDKILSNYKTNLKKFTLGDPLNPSSAASSFSKFSSAIEIPQFPPKKSGSVIMPMGIGGIPPIVIPGSAISKYIISGTKSTLDTQDYDKLIPGGFDGFIHLTKDDIKTISSKLAINFTNKSSIPAISNLPDIPFKSRPQDFIEFVMNFLPVHPASDIGFILQWNLQKSPPRVPISADLISEYIKIQNSIFAKLPWQIVILLGRNIINLINPLYNREDLPRWDRMSLKNPFFVVFLDEFLRSAADISGGFKFFIGIPQLLYPLPDLEIPLGFGTTININ